MKRVTLTLISFIFSASILFAQNNKIDSLETVLKTAKEDTSKVNVLLDLGRAASNQGNFDKTLKYGSDAKKLAEKLSFKKGIARGCNVIGMAYYINDNYPDALENYSDALKLRLEINDKQGIGDSYNNIGNCYYREGKYPEAMQNFYTALKYFEEIGGVEMRIASVYTNMSNVYLSQNRYAESLKSLLQALPLMEKVGNRNGIAQCYNNISIAYKGEALYDTALIYLLKSLKITKELGLIGEMAVNYINIGTLYDDPWKNYPLALSNFFEAHRISEEIGDQYHIAVCKANIGNVYMKMKKYSEAKIFLMGGLEMAKKLGIKDLVENCYGNLAKLSEREGDYKSAYQYHELFSEMNDSLLNENNNKQIAQMKTLYETEKKDKELVIKNVKIEKQRAAIKYIIGGFIVLMLFISIYFRLYVQKRKALFRRNLLDMEMKALRSQMNPHFTFNVLNSIQYFIVANDINTAELYVVKFATLIRMILEQSRTAYITLAQEVSMLKLYLELEEMRFKRKFRFNIEAEADLDCEKIIIPGMLIQPIVENAIKHGIEHKEGEAGIDIKFSSTKTTLLCSVTDNGIGRAAAEKLKSGTPHKSSGTAITKERMEALGSLYNIRLIYNTEDIVNDRGLPSGTKVTLEMPLIYS